MVKWLPGSYNPVNAAAFVRQIRTALQGGGGYILSGKGSYRAISSSAVYNQHVIPAKTHGFQFLRFCSAQSRPSSCRLIPIKRGRTLFGKPWAGHPHLCHLQPGFCSLSGFVLAGLYTTSSGQRRHTTTEKNSHPQ